jgi:hypothetical protein
VAADLDANISTVEAQLKASEPDRSILARGLDAIAKIGQGAAAGALGKIAADHFDTIQQAVRHLL